MTETDERRKRDELDRLLNDPSVPIEPDRVWSLLAEPAERDRVRLSGAGSRPAA